MPDGGHAAVRPQHRSRVTERHILALGLALSGTFLVAAVSAAIMTVVAGGSSWAALHLALAGAAGVAIGAFMPHFAITLAGTAPQPAPQRLATIGLLATGSALAVAGVALLGGRVALGGSILVVGGLALVGWQTVAPLRSPLARRHPIVTVTYLLALAELATGVLLGGLGAAGWDPVTRAWAALRPAHAWLTLLGAVSLTIFGTLIYLAPTILGARIRASRTLAVAATGMLVGPPLAALGFALLATPVVLAGTVLTLVGALGQIGYVVDTLRRRGRYTSEHDWRRVAVWHLAAGTGWFAAAVAAALVGFVDGGRIAAWSLGALAVPLVAGWMAQELVGSWTHLAPSVTPGSPGRHAEQRRTLAVASRVRPIAWNVGVGLAWAGAALGVTPLAVGGGALLAASAIASVALLLRALARQEAGVRPGASAPAG